MLSMGLVCMRFVRCDMKNKDTLLKVTLILLFIVLPYTLSALFLGATK